MSAAVLAIGLPGYAQETTPATPTTEAASAPAAGGATAPVVAKDLTTLADDFIHYSLVNNVELAQANGEAILASPQSPEEVLKAFDAADQGRDYRMVLTQDQHRAELRDVATRLQDRLDEGYRHVARDPQNIRKEIDRLSGGPRAYANAKDRLEAAGEFAVPIYLEYLQNSGKNELHPFIVRVMGEIGRPLLNPLIEALRTSDPGLRVEVINIIGQIGYPQALPALRAIQADDKTQPETRTAADNAIAMIDRSGQASKMSPAELYLRGGENYYDRKSSYLPLHGDEKTNPVWIFDPGLNNVQAVQTPTAIWNSVMALRFAEAALKIDANNGEAISLWLAADARREIELPPGATDPTKTAATQDAAFYLRATGPIYVNPVLAKALDAHDAALALRAIDALEATGGVSGLVSGADSPLVRALSNPDRAVRFRAAFALARANPPSQFASFFRVVPILAEAINSTGSPSALLVMPDNNLRNQLTDALHNSDAHFTVYAGESLSDALEQARRAPGLDVVIVPEGPERNRVAEVGRTDYRLTGVPVLVTAPAGDLNDVKLRLTEMKGYAAVDEKSDAAAITAALQGARADVGAVPISADAATQYATTALDLLGTLAADHKTIYNVSEAVPTLVDSLKDKRPEIVTASARVLGEMNSSDGEQALATSALNPETTGATRIMFFQQLAESAKRTGNQLDANVINNLIKVVSSDPDAKTRIAAATALGALNVPSNQASTLILQQAK